MSIPKDPFSNPGGSKTLLPDSKALPFGLKQSAKKAAQAFTGLGDYMSEAQFEKHLKEIFSKAQIQPTLDEKILLRRQKGGLFNLGNTCWLNAVIQMLKHSKTYLAALEKKSIGHPHALLAKTLCEILDLSKKDVSKKLNLELLEKTELFMKLLTSSCPLLARGQQHDPHEALLLLFDLFDLHKDLPQIAKRSFLKAVSGHSEHHSDHPDLSDLITLSDTSMRSIQKGLLQEYMAPQKLDEDNLFLFEGLTQKQAAYKIDYFTSDTIPKELIIQAPRFFNGPIRTLPNGDKHSDRFKNTSPIIFEPQIQIPLYSSEGLKVERILTLELSTVIAHEGSLEGGHYMAYHKNEEGRFTRYNDLEVSTLSFEQAMREIQVKGYLATYQLTEEAPLRIEAKTLREVIPNASSLSADENQDLSPSLSQETDWDVLEDLKTDPLLSLSTQEATLSAAASHDLVGQEGSKDPRKVLALLKPTPAKALNSRQWSRLSGHNSRYQF